MMISNKWYRFEIPLTPRQKNNSRPIFMNKKTGKHFLGKNTLLSEYEKNATLILSAARSKAGLSSPLSYKMCAVFIFEYEKTCRADGDNLVKAAQDVAASAQIILNDKLLKHVEFEIVENTGLPDRTIMQFGRCTKHSESEGQAGRVSRNEAIQNLQKIAREGEGR